METLWERLEGLPDRRTAKGKRYSLASIVSLSFAAMLSGANDLMAVYRWVKANQPELQAEIAHAFGDDSPLAARRLPGTARPADRSARS